MKSRNPAQTGRSSAATAVSFQLDWKFNAQFADVFAALRGGLFQAAGMRLMPRPWADGVDVVAKVRADFACAERNLIIAAHPCGRWPRCFTPRPTG